MRFTTSDVLTGDAGTATLLVSDGPPDRPEQAATVVTWFLHCPGQSPAWDRFVLSAVHLRPIEGTPAPTVKVPGATHELFLIALDPRPDPVPTDTATWTFLRPINFVDQFEVPGDDDARELLAGLARWTAEGRLWAEPPLSGQVEPWRTVLLKSAAHMRGEPHAP